MRQATATPGPWHVAASSTGMIDRCVVSNGGDQIATVNTTNNTQANRAANARLIASAPEMLEALEAIVARINGEWDHPALVRVGGLTTAYSEDIKRIAKVAIDHATGRQAGKG